MATTAAETGPPSTLATTAPSRPLPAADRLRENAFPGGPPLAPDIAARATTTVRRFLQRLRSEDVDAAADLWTGYPFRPGEKGEALAAFALGSGAIVASVRSTTYATPAASSHLVPVVTVVLLAPGVGRRALAFVLEPSGSTITNLTTTRVADGQPVVPGQQLELPASAVEGGVRVFADGVEIPSISDIAAEVVRFAVPDDASGELVVTVSEASPEVPGAYAARYPVRGG